MRELPKKPRLIKLEEINSPVTPRRPLTISKRLIRNGMKHKKHSTESKTECTKKEKKSSKTGVNTRRPKKPSERLMPNTPDSNNWQHHSTSNRLPKMLLTTRENREKQENSRTNNPLMQEMSSKRHGLKLKTSSKTQRMLLDSTNSMLNSTEKSKLELKLTIAQTPPTHWLQSWVHGSLSTHNGRPE